VIEQLETNELYELEPPIKLQILVGLCHRIMASYSVQDYMDERNNEAGQLWYVHSAFTLIQYFIEMLLATILACKPCIIVTSLLYRFNNFVVGATWVKDKLLGHLNV